MTASAAGTLGAWVLGQDTAQRAYELQFRMARTVGSGVPDAWRFEPAGCAAGRLQPYWFIAAAIKSCPSLPGSGLATPTSSIAYDSNAECERVGIRLDYPTAVSATNPLRRSILVWLEVDFSGFVAGPGNPPASCGGLDEPVCIQLTSATWTALDGGVHPWTITTPFATVNAAALGGPAACATTPARAATWGTIKQQYR